MAGTYAAFAGVAALVAGFAGVVLVFSTLSSPAWARVRDLGGKSLVRNWISPLRVTISAALLAISAALLDQAARSAAGWWAFEMSVVLVISAAVRIGWLLRGLLEAQLSIDATSNRQPPSLAELGLTARPEQ